MNPTAIQSSIHRRPLLFSLLVVVAAGGGELLLKVTLVELLSLELTVITIGIVSGAVISLLGAFAVGRLRLWRELGLIRRPSRARSLLWFLPFVIYGVLPLTAGPDLTAGKAAAVTAFGLLIAFWKLVVLGLVLFAWLPRGRRTAAAITAGMWAAMHLIFGILTGAAALPTLVLAVSYLFLSFAFIAVRLRTGLLWPLVASYALLLATAAAVQGDEASNLATSVADLVPLLVISVLLGAYALVVWPRRQQRPVEAARATHEERTAPPVSTSAAFNASGTLRRAD